MNNRSLPASYPIAQTEKKTFRSLHPGLCDALEETITRSFGSVRSFSLAAGLHPTRVHALLREGDNGAIPRMDSFTEMLRAINHADPIGFESVMANFLKDVHPSLSVSIARSSEEDADLESLKVRYQQLLSEWGVEKMSLLFEVITLLPRGEGDQSEVQVGHYRQ